MTPPTNPGGQQIGDDVAVMLPGLADTAPGPKIRSPRGWAGALLRQQVQQAVDAAGWGGIVLPYSNLSRFDGFPVIAWTAGARERFQFGPGPVLVRQALALWEGWPLGVSSLPPPSPLTIVGFVSVATWRPAFQAACELAGKGAVMILTPQRPSAIRLCDADYAGVHVVQMTTEGACEVLVHGRGGPIESSRRTSNIRYWEERLFAHALASWREGVIPMDLLPVRAIARAQA